ncbi:YidH family protein [Salinisphaera sp. Q1T1-3]|uniref:YidH family protein n=1 Tax=Salinisphaera sp. Q1T1-3 TaxID=2321229 RepID=UPI000E75C015|nr:DUF202 domain-containing protein [Salinisphaera sp. Q1T1-3]RJS91279.1 DUF202 domain-containing protein [Salinisphaera sp. Q1T1-3]
MSESDEPAKEHEPDYRFTLANERTFLAWIRTALALLAGAVAITQLVPDFGIPHARELLAAMLAILSVAVVAGSALRWRSAQRAMRCDAPLPSTLLPWLLAGGVVIVGVLIMAFALTYGVNGA